MRDRHAADARRVVACADDGDRRGLVAAAQDGVVLLVMLFMFFTGDNIARSSLLWILLDRVGEAAIARRQKAFAQMRELVRVEVRSQRRAQTLRIERAVDRALDEMQPERRRLGDRRTLALHAATDSRIRHHAVDHADFLSLPAR